MSVLKIAVTLKGSYLCSITPAKSSDVNYGSKLIAKLTTSPESFTAVLRSASNGSYVALLMDDALMGFLNVPYTSEKEKVMEDFLYYSDELTFAKAKLKKAADPASLL